MPPPELFERAAPASVGALMLRHLRAEAPVPRHNGPRAAEANLEVRLADARAAGDLDAERDVTVTLARLLAARGRDLGTATALAQRAIEIAEDPHLRVELAGWLAGLGATAAAAEALRPLVAPDRPAEAARTTVKIAVLLARAGDAAHAAEALDEAASLDPDEPMAVELFGTLSAWAPGTVPPEGAAAAYLEAARRRSPSAGAGDPEAAYEDLLRAFEVAPHEAAAADAVAAALAARGLPAAADEVLRLSVAEVRDKAAALAVHRRRMLAALKDGEAARAVGALLDAGMDGELSGDEAVRVDEALALAGIYELLAARVEARAERLSGPARGEAYQALARLCAGPLASPDRAIEAWIDALAADPSNAAARTALRDHATAMHDPTPLVEALIRAASAEGLPAAERVGVLRELAAVAEDRLSDPGLASWALDALAAAGQEGDRISAENLGLVSRVRRQDDDLAAARRAYEVAQPLEPGGPVPEPRIKALRRIVAVLQGRPGEVGAYVTALAELSLAAPADRAVLLALERAAHRSANLDALETVLRDRIRSAARVDATRARLGLAVIARRRGDDARAFEELAFLLADAPGHRAAASEALLLATRLGRVRERADMLAHIAGPASPPLRSVLLAVVSDLYRQAGAGRLARRAAEGACEADPGAARALAALASVVDAVQEGDGSEALPKTDRLAAAAVERAMAAVIPRGAWCERLARAFDALGEPALAFAWTQRWLALHPGSAEAMRQLLQRAAVADGSERVERSTAPPGGPIETEDAGDAGARIADALGWVLAQPRPLVDLAEAITEALFALLDVDRARARTLARRTLDVVGPRVPVLRARLIDLSDRAADPGLAIAVLERYLAAEAPAGIPNGAAVMVLFELSRRRTAAGDYDGAARELARAVERGADPGMVLDRTVDLEAAMRDAAAWLGSDGLVALAEAKAGALAALGPDSYAAASAAFRELGSLRWDLADDTRRAEEAFFRACELLPAGGVERYARDLTAFGGVHHAIDALLARAEALAALSGVEGEGARRLSANLLIEAANLATEHGMPERALAAAAGAIERDPTRADAVPLVEKNAHVEGGIAVLDRSYDLLASAAMGCFGTRSAHYRAARQLERRGALDIALRHAAACFEAVPSEGTAYVLLTRLAERAPDPTEAVRALERVAEAGDAGMRPMWLKRAAALAGAGEDGLRTRFDLLLRALIVRPDPGTVTEVASAARALAAADEDAAEQTGMVRLRVERAVKASLRRLDGPDGARAAIAMARLALELGDVSLAFAALDKATEADGDVDEYEAIEAEIPHLTAAREDAEAWLGRLRATAEKPYSSVGKALLRMASRVASSLGDGGARAALLVAAVKRDTDDDALVTEADLAVVEHGDPDLAAKLDAVAPLDARALAHLRLAEERERQGRDSEAISALTRLREATEVDPAVRARATAQLQRLLSQPGRDDDAEVFLRAELARSSLAPPARRRVAHDLADLFLRRDDPRSAFSVLASLESEGGPPDRDLLAELRGVARAAGDLGRYAAVLDDALRRAEGDALRLEILRELAPLHTELGEGERAAACYEEIARLDPADAQALELLERSANEQGDHVAIAALLARRIALSPAGDKKRMLRLRRAAVLEQRLGLLDDAAEELSALLAEAPNDVSALRFLADVHERRGALFAAAELLERLEATAATSEEKAEYGLRAAAAYLGGGKAELAERSLGTVANLAQREAVLELRVEIARQTGDARTLVDALDELASSPSEPSERRAALLVEAARAASTSGDDAGATSRARRAVKLAPNLPDAVLEARRLELKGGGAGTPREAQAAVDELMRIEPRLAAGQMELYAFLLAEELDVIQGGGAGMRELSRRHAEVGPLPLIALGMAERMVRLKSFDAALPLFEQALAGDLRGMRTRGRVALAAAEAAVHAQAYTAAVRLLDVAASEAETQAIAQRRQLELAATIGDPAIARQALEELLHHATGLDRARVLLQLGRLLAEDEPERAAGLLAEAAPLSSADRALPNQIADAREVVEERLEEIRRAAVEAPVPSEPEVASADVISVPVSTPAAPVEPVASEPRAPSAAAPEPPAPAPAPAEPEPAPRIAAKVTPPPLPPPSEAAQPRRPPPEPMEASFSDLDLGADPPPRGPAAVQRDAPVRAAGEADEQSLLQELAGGSFEAGEQLLALYGARPGERAPEVLGVRRQQALIRLGDPTALKRLVEASVQDGNATYARAIDHVLHVWDAASPGPQPPPLAAQRLAPDLVTALLFRPVAESPVHEALALVLDTGLYRRDVGQYQLTGVARVQPTGGSVLGEVYGVVARYLGQSRTALFYQRGAAGAAEPSFKVALLSPPAVVLAGEVKDETAELRYLLGAALAGAMPEHALVNALGEEGLRTLIDALHAAFGPVANLPRGNAAVARLGQNLWQLVPPRADRRLRELCADLSAITYEAAVSVTRQAMRRAGFFASGSLGTALAMLGQELDLPLSSFASAPDGLVQAVAAHPEVADLVRLAVRMELAEARWTPGTQPDRRRSDSGARSIRWDGK